jgi:predicted nucleic acid-binding protein
MRAYDAVHLASALTVGRADLLFVTWDEKLAAAGRRAELGVIP